MAQTAKKENFIQWFIRKWKSSPIFSTGCVLVLMVILQTVALGFRDASFGAWLQRWGKNWICLLYTSPSPRDGATSRMPSSA